jgi:hypothetical protein
VAELSAGAFRSCAMICPSVKGNGTWPSLVKALVWGTREPGFKSRRPDYVMIWTASGTLRNRCSLR